MKKLTTKNLIELISIIFTTLLLCSNFLQMHFSSDTYVLCDLGYFEYPLEYFFRDARIISGVVCLLGGVLKLPIPVYIVTMDFIGMIFLSISIHMISKVIRDILNPKNILYEVLIILASFCLILNQYSLEYLLFPESGVMCMGVFFVVLAVRIFLKRPKKMYLKIFSCLFLTGISYQPELNIFPVLAILMYVLKQIKENKKMKVFLKEFFTEMFKLALLMIGIIAVTTGLVVLGKFIFDDSKKHFVKIASQRAFWLRLKSIKGLAKEIWVYSTHYLPKNSLTVIVCITLMLLITAKSKIQNFVYYILLIAFAFLSSILPLFVCNSGACGRVNVPTMMVIGISVLILIGVTLCSNSKNKINSDGENVVSTNQKNSNGVAVLSANPKVEINPDNVTTLAINKKNKIKAHRVFSLIVNNTQQINTTITTIFTLAIFLFNGIFIVQNTAEHIAANKVDENMGATINALIQKYERETGIQVTKFGYTFDPKPQQSAVGIKPTQSMTERKFACEWSIVYAMNYYCGKKFKTVSFERPQEGDLSNGSIPDYNQFLEEQIFFNGDTVYMIIY